MGDGEPSAYGIGRLSLFSLWCRQSVSPLSVMVFSFSFLFLLQLISGVLGWYRLAIGWK
jgi:hypothetical protein